MAGRGQCFRNSLFRSSTDKIISKKKQRAILGLSQPPRRVWNWVAENWLYSVNGKMLCDDLGREKCLCDGLMFLLQSEKNFKKNQRRNHVWWVDIPSPKWKEFLKKSAAKPPLLFLSFISSAGQCWLRLAVWHALCQAVETQRDPGMGPAVEGLPV